MSLDILGFHVFGISMMEKVARVVLGSNSQPHHLSFIAYGENRVCRNY
jgi:hypothetical protein